MPYTNCAACGAKALVGATRCPRCQAPFVSYEPNGERVPTVNCPKCGVQRPVAIGVCPNCSTSTAPTGARLARGFTMVGIGIAIIVGIGYLISQRVDHTTPPPPAVVAPKDSEPVADSIVFDSVAFRNELAMTPSAPSANAAPSNSNAASSAPVAAKPAAVPVAPPSTVAPVPKTTPIDPAMIPPKPSAPPKVAVPDTGSWEYAVAATWVRVRSAPTRDSDVLRMVDSAQRVRLGPALNGWRAVRVGVDRGWVDPRLFTMVPGAKP